ncbi:MAG: helix-turn-helix domain-containing protein [Lachnospiraceae bacterium]|nr:helix-turn-helix domain-containing protein [Lachnospiraceae bacterium]
MNVGEKIKNIRIAHKMTQEQLSEASGISLTSLRKYETNERNPKPEQLLKLSEALGISINVFLDFDIRTVSDLLSLIFRMNEQIDMKITADKYTDGNYKPETVQLAFSSDEVNARLCAYLAAIDKKEELEASKSTLSAQTYAQKLESITKQITDLTNLLLDDNTDISKNAESPANSDGKDSPAAKKENAPDTASNAFLFATNSDLQDLFFDCTPDEAALLIENAKLLKEYIRKL